LRAGEKLQARDGILSLPISSRRGMGDMDLVGTSYQFSAVSRVTSRARNERAFRQCVGQKGLTRKGTTSSRAA